MECQRCGQTKWDLVIQGSEVLEDDGEGTQKIIGKLVALKCHYCGIYVRMKGNEIGQSTQLGN